MTEFSEHEGADMNHFEQRTGQRLLGWVWVGAGVWGALGVVLGWPGIRDANADAKRWVLLASTALPLCATGAALLVKRRSHLGIACVLLFLSIGTPTYFAWVFNVIPILLIIAVAVALRMEHQADDACGTRGLQ